jgi:hypothetical protein
LVVDSPLLDGRRSGNHGSDVLSEKSPELNPIQTTTKSRPKNGRNAGIPPETKPASLGFKRDERKHVRRSGVKNGIFDFAKPCFDVFQFAFQDDVKIPARSPRKKNFVKKTNNPLGLGAVRLLATMNVKISDEGPRDNSREKDGNYQTRKGLAHSSRKWTRRVSKRRSLLISAGMRTEGSQGHSGSLPDAKWRF